MNYSTFGESVAADQDGVIFDVGSVYSRLTDLPDPRARRGRRYELAVLLLVVLLAKLAGQDKPDGIAEWVQLRAAFLGEVFQLKRPLTPHAMTYRRVLANAALALAKTMLGGAGTIYAFSDFQKSNWEAVRELPAGVACRLRPVTENPVDNIAIVGAELTPASPVAGETVEVVCTVFNCSGRPVEQSVRLELGETAQERRVAVPAFGTGQASFNESKYQEAVRRGWKVFSPAEVARHRENVNNVYDLLRWSGASSLVIPTRHTDCVRSARYIAGDRRNDRCMVWVVDGQVLGPYPVLNPRDTYFMAILSASEAAVHFGDKAPWGAIVIYTRMNGDQLHP